MNMRELVKDLEARRAEVQKMGGPERVEKQRARGKMTARDRFQAFFDDGVYFEVGQHGTQMGLAAGPDGKDRPPADAVVCGFGKVDGRMVCAASYEARRFGVHSAMPALRAERLCPDAVFVPPDFVRYRAVSRQVREIFLRHTAQVEPLSLDEAYLDVTEPVSPLPTATAIAQEIRRQIREETSLTASAGIAPNKFLAKIASDWRKPDGQFVVRPHQVEDFLAPLPVAKIPGVGKVMQGKLSALGIQSVGQLRERTREELQQRFGSFGDSLYRRARGIDERRVEPDQPVQSISAEDTFENDLPLQELAPAIRRLAAKTWASSRKTERVGRTVVLKLKTSQFRILTRSHTPATPPASAEALTRIALSLCDRVEQPPGTLYRLIGVGLGGFREREETAEQGVLFDAEA